MKKLKKFLTQLFNFTPSIYIVKEGIREEGLEEVIDLHVFTSLKKKKLFIKNWNNYWKDYNLLLSRGESKWKATSGTVYWLEHKNTKEQINNTDY